MDISTLWEIAKTIGPGGVVICLLLWFDERRERRRIQNMVTKLHRENTRRLESLLRKTNRLVLALGASAATTAKSSAAKRRGGK